MSPKAYAALDDPLGLTGDFWRLGVATSFESAMRGVARSAHVVSRLEGLVSIEASAAGTDCVDSFVVRFESSDVEYAGWMPAGVELLKLGTTKTRILPVGGTAGTSDLPAPTEDCTRFPTLSAPRSTQGKHWLIPLPRDLRPLEIISKTGEVLLLNFDFFLHAGYVAFRQPPDRLFQDRRFHCRAIFSPRNILSHACGTDHVLGNIRPVADYNLNGGGRRRFIRAALTAAGVPVCPADGTVQQVQDLADGRAAYLTSCGLLYGFTGWEAGDTFRNGEPVGDSPLTVSEDPFSTSDNFPLGKYLGGRYADFEISSGALTLTLPGAEFGSGRRHCRYPVDSADEGAVDDYFTAVYAAEVEEDKATLDILLSFESSHSGITAGGTYPETVNVRRRLLSEGLAGSTVEFLAVLNTEDPIVLRLNKFIRDNRPTGLVTHITHLAP